MTKYMETLKPQDCVLLLVDVQKVLLDLCAESGNISRNTAALIEIAGIFDIPVLLSVQNAGKLGGFLPELVDRVALPRVFNKMEFDCFENAPLAEGVRETGRKIVLLAGLEGHICVLQTGLGALRQGYAVHVAADAVSARSVFNRDLGLRRLEHAGAVISSTETIIFELMNRAGTPEFRTALPSLKRLQA